MSTTAKKEKIDRAEGSNAFDFYNGAVTLERRMYGTRPSFKRRGAPDTILSVTRCTGNLDKSRALIPWAVKLVGTHITSAIELAKAANFSREEIIMLVAEAQLAPDRAKESGGNTGTLIHDYAHEFAQLKIAGSKKTPSIAHLDEKNEEHNKALNGISAFLDWYNGNHVVFKKMEALVYYNSKVAGFTAAGDTPTEFFGYVDLIAEVNGKMAVVDYKTSKGIYNEQRYQLAAYVVAAGMGIQSSHIVNFNKETGDLITKEIPYSETLKDYAAFLGLHAVALRERELDAEYKNSKKQS